MFRADETNFREGKRQPAAPRRRRFGGRVSLFARRRSPLFAGGTRYAPRHARRGGSSSSQKVLRYFLGALCSGHALKSARKFTLSAEAAGMRPMGCALPKMRFWHAQEIFHEICFVLTKQISVSWRALPSAARFEGHTFQSARRIHSLRRSRANCVARRKSVVLLARKFLQKYSRNLFRADETNFREWEGSALCGAL